MHQLPAGAYKLVQVHLEVTNWVLYFSLILSRVCSKPFLLWENLIELDCIVNESNEIGIDPREEIGRSELWAYSSISNRLNYFSTHESDGNTRGFAHACGTNDTHIHSWETLKFVINTFSGFQANVPCSSTTTGSKIMKRLERDRTETRLQFLKRCVGFLES